MFSKTTFQRKVYLLVFSVAFPIVFVLTGCTSSPPEPGLTLADAGGWMTCEGNFSRRVNLGQQNALEPQEITIQVNPATNGNVQPGARTDPARIEGLENDTLQTLYLRGTLADRCQAGSVVVKAEDSTGVSAESEILITPAPVIVTIEDLRVQNTDFSYTVSMACCGGARDSVTLDLSTKLFPSIASLDPPDPAKLTMQCGTAPQTGNVKISGTLQDAAQPGRVHLFLNDFQNKTGCVADTTIPSSTEAE